MSISFNHLSNFFDCCNRIISEIDINQINTLTQELKKIRSKKGRLFCIGVGGSAANSSHMVNDFRKLCNIEAYSPTDNISELTARINDDGWDKSISEWLKVSNLSKEDALFILSVGGGNLKHKVSVNLINSIKLAKKKYATTFAVVGKKNGFTFKNADYVISIPEVDKKLITPLSESFQSVVWHSIVSNPILQLNKTKW
jgi:D-sedoheptulose 7-phosphate isomerase